MMGARSIADRLDSSTDDLRLISVIEVRPVNGATAIVAMPVRIVCEPKTHSRKGIPFLQNFDGLNLSNFL